MAFRAPFMRPRTVVLAAVCVIGGVAATAQLFSSRETANPLAASVKRGSLTALLTTTGTLRPIQSLTYRSPLNGREVEIVELAPEGTRVGVGDLVVRLDSTELQREVEKTRQDIRQSELDLQVAQIEREDAVAADRGLAEGDGALSVEEARTRLQLMERRAERLRREYEQLKPLLAKGFITRDELGRSADAIDQVEQELVLERRRNQILVGLTRPRDTQHAKLQLAQRESQLENARTKVGEARNRLGVLTQQIEDCRIYARRPGLVVYEDFLNASPTRKIRVGDRVGASQGLVTIPEVNRMVLETSVIEGDMHRLRVGQAAVIRVEAFPDLRLSGRVARLGALAHAAPDRPPEDKRFDLSVELDPSSADLRPEMSGRAEIVVGTRRDVLLMPINAVFEQQGGYVAHVARGSAIETRELELGESNELEIEVLAGVREGERVMLTDAGARGVQAAPAPAAGRERESAQAAGNALQPH